MENEICHPDSHCPLIDVLDAISPKWTVQIFRQMASGPVRTRQFLRALPGLSMKSLQERLKVLVEFGFVSRTEFDKKLPHVEYALTEKGNRLLTILSELKKLGLDESTTCPIDSLVETLRTS